MNGITLTKRTLSDVEINKLIEDIVFFPDLIYVSKKHWKRIPSLLVLESNNKFVGVSAIYEFSNWIKIGPLVILKKYHGKGYGKKVIRKIIEDSPDKNIFVASTNPIVKKILNSLGFMEKKSVFSIPMSVKLFLFRQLFEYTSLTSIKEFIRKRLTMKRSSFGYYIKYVN